VAPFELIDVSGGAAPRDYTLSPNEQMAISAVTATFDGTGAGGAFLPTLSFYAPSGELLARQFAEEQEAGEVSEVTFAPFLRRPEVAAPGEDQVPSLCGGINAGPIAEGDAVGRTLVLTVTRPVPCDCILTLFPGGLNPHRAFVLNVGITSVVDSRGNTWFGTGAALGNIGAASDNIGGAGDATTLNFSGGWIAPISAGDITTGDTITITFDANGDAPFHGMAMVFAVINVSNMATTQTFGGAGPLLAHGNIDSYPLVGTDPTALDWCADLGQCGVQAPTPTVISGMPAVGLIDVADADYSPFQGTRIGQISAGGATMAAVLARCVYNDASGTAPGGQWDSAGTILVGNYQFVRWVCPFS
jgi:hypothetical protein